jgi:hypothetical protein
MRIGSHVIFPGASLALLLVNLPRVVTPGIVSWLIALFLVVNEDCMFLQRSNASKGPLNFSFFPKWSFKFQKSQTSPLSFKSLKQVFLVFESFQTSP